MKQVVGPALTAEPQRATARAVACPLANDLDLYPRHSPQYGGRNRDEPPAPDECSAGQARGAPRPSVRHGRTWTVAIRPTSREPRAARGSQSGPADLAWLEEAAHNIALTAPDGGASGAQEPHGGVELVVMVEEAVVLVEHAAGGHARPFVRQSLRGAGQAECAGRTGDARRVRPEQEVVEYRVVAPHPPHDPVAAVDQALGLLLRHGQHTRHIDAPALEVARHTQLWPEGVGATRAPCVDCAGWRSADEPQRGSSNHRTEQPRIRLRPRIHPPSSLDAASPTPAEIHKSTRPGRLGSPPS